MGEGVVPERAGRRGTQPTFPGEIHLQVSSPSWPGGPPHTLISVVASWSSDNALGSPYERAPYWYASGHVCSALTDRSTRLCVQSQ